MSIWEVRSRKQNYTYSKVMLWVAFDRGLRLAEKRCLPCPNRAKWMATRDEIYEDIMTKGKVHSTLKGPWSNMYKATAQISDASSRVTRVVTISTHPFSSPLSCSSSRPTILVSYVQWIVFSLLPS